MIIIFNIFIERYGVPYIYGGSDDIAFENQADFLLGNIGVFDYFKIRGLDIRFWFHNSIGYVYFIYLIKLFASFIGEYHTLLPRILNCFFLGLLSVNSYRLSKQFLDNIKTSLAVGIFVGFSPIIVFKSVNILRDSLVALLIVYLMRIILNKKLFAKTVILLRTVVISIVLLLIISQLRSSQAYIITLMIVFLLMSLHTEKKIQLMKITTIFMMLLILTFFMFLNIEFISSQIIKYLLDYSSYRAEMSDGLSSIIFSMPLIISLPFRFIYLFMIPLPIPSKFFETNWMSVGSIIQIIFFPYLLYGIYFVINNRAKRNLLIIFLTMISVPIISFTDRHLIQLLPFAAIITAVGYEKIKTSKELIYSISFVLFVYLGLLYILLKG